MKAILLAGGDQTRFGSDPWERSKILFPLGQNDTLLLNTIRQIEKTDVEEIIVALRDKEFIADYLKGQKLAKRLRIDRRDIKVLGNFALGSSKEIPATFVFGDIYFPSSALSDYLVALEKPDMQALDGVIGTCSYPVGDYFVSEEHGLVTRISKKDASARHTCGIFTILNTHLLQSLPRRDKMTDVFIDLISLGARIGYVDLKEGLIDLDTGDAAAKLLAVLK